MEFNLSPEAAVNLILQALPYPDHITIMKIEDSCIRFSWRNSDFRLELNYLSVEEMQPNVLVSNNISILVEHILKKYFLGKEIGE